jgi:hypothetical protein
MTQELTKGPLKQPRQWQSHTQTSFRVIVVKLKSQDKGRAALISQDGLHMTKELDDGYTQTTTPEEGHGAPSFPSLDAPYMRQL